MTKKIWPNKNVIVINDQVMCTYSLKMLNLPQFNVFNSKKEKLIKRLLKHVTEYQVKSQVW